MAAVALFLVIFTITSGITSSTAKDSCSSLCAFQNDTDQVAINDLWCDEDCRKNNCATGCQLLEEALKSSCYTACSRVRGQMNYCLLGCNLAVSSYVPEFKDRIGNLPVPIASSFTNSSVSLRWIWNLTASDLLRRHNSTVSLQWRHDQQEMGGTWETVPSSSEVSQSHAVVNELQPYCSYRFRLLVIIAADREPLTSNETAVITTLPYGSPKSAALNLNAVALDANRISIKWDPPLFPSGRLHSYHLSIREACPPFHPGFKDVIDMYNQTNVRSFVFVHLTPNTTYTVSVAARNIAEPDKLGPAATLNVTTLSIEKQIGNQIEQPVLIVVDRKYIYHKTRPMVIYHDELPIYNASGHSLITGLAVHSRQGIFFVSDDQGFVYELSLKLGFQSNEKTHWSLEAFGSDTTVQALSVDWLFDRLYMVLENKENVSMWQIARSKLDGREPTHLVTDLRHKPFHIEVDPFNGFLIYAIKNNDTLGGLYSIDLHDLSDQSSLPIKADNHTSKINRIQTDGVILAFTIDPINSRIFVMTTSKTNSQTEILAVSYTGSTTSVIRNSTRSVTKVNPSSLSFVNALFYWINEDQIFFEESDKGAIHVNTAYAVENSSHTSLVSCDLNNQPIPIPLTPVRNLQALFATQSVHITWDPPSSFAKKGRGAWQDWLYHLQIENLDNGASVLYKNDIKNTTIDLEDLHPNTTYSIRIRPFSNNNDENEMLTSSTFIGRTLPDINHHRRTIYWATADANGTILESDPIGRNFSHFSQVNLWPQTPQNKHRVSMTKVISMTWMQDYIYAVTSANKLYKIHMESKNVTLMENIEAVSVAADWLSKKLYWYSARTQMIFRSFDNGSQSEPVVFTNGVVNSLAIHSPKGRLFWCTGNSVHSSFLNGDAQQELWSREFGSGSQAVAMTIDHDAEEIYWMVLQINGEVLLFKTDVDLMQEIVRVNEQELTLAKGPLQFMSGRLLWLHQKESALISVGDLNGTNTYQMKQPDQRSVVSFLVVDESQQPVIPFGNYCVYPDPVETKSIALNRTDQGNIILSWSPVTNVNYGVVHYDIKVNKSDVNGSMVTSDNYYYLPDHWNISHFTEISVSIRSFTIWSWSSQSEKRLRSPPSVPEVPTNPRFFVSFVREEIEIFADIHFRWSPPIHSNGELIGYKIHCWNENPNIASVDCQRDIYVSVGANEYSFKNLAVNVTYFISIQASTQVGYGNATSPLAISTSKEIPIPHLLIITNKALWMADLDKHPFLNKSLANDVSPLNVNAPVALTLLTDDKEIFWIDKNNALYYEEMDIRGSTSSKIYQLKGTGKSLVIDWVSRHLYWSQQEASGVHSIFQLDLNSITEGKQIVPRMIHSDENIAQLVEMDPFSSRLIWISIQKNGTGTLMTLDLTTNSNQPLSCAMDSKVKLLLAAGTVTAVDWSDTQNPRLLWISADHQDVWSSDWKGCHSVVELNSLELKRTGWPPTSLAVDRTHFYWSNSNEKIFKVKRLFASTEESNSVHQSQTSALTSGKEILAELVTDIRQIKSVNFQPLPGNECLVPLPERYSVQVLNSTKDSITLKMPDPLRPPNCGGITMASPIYHLYYFKANENETHGCLTNLTLCIKHTSSDNTVVLTNLSPYSRYGIRVGISNHYKKNEFPIGDAVLASTLIGAPSKPRKLLILNLSPSAIRLLWLSPSSLNGHNVTYSVHFRSNTIYPSENHMNWSGVDNGSSSLNHTMDIQYLAPSRIYNFWVQAYSSDGKQWNQSDVVQVKTYDNPSPLTIQNVSSNYVVLEWKSPSDKIIKRHQLEKMSHLKKGEWQIIDDFKPTNSGQLYHFNVGNLTTLTTYSFRLKLEYELTNFTWPVESDGVSCKTKGNVPGRPLPPRPTKKIDSSFSFDNLVELYWGPTPTNGYPVSYTLEMNIINETTSVKNGNYEEKLGKSSTQSNWVSIYNGSDYFYLAHNLTSGYKYQFRVQAFNEMGASDYSDPSSAVQIQELVGEGAPTNANMILSVSVSALIAFCSAMTIFLFYACRRPTFLSKKTKGDISVGLSSTSEMTDLATLRELPQRDSFVQQNNAIYGVGDGELDQELALLPHIRFEDLVITKFLGRGAFGEVFEGATINLTELNHGDTRVAVKTLRKGATETEKSEFLKEALLMSHFKHKHILRLLGVCLDADPNFILLELMEGGDLLSFLRNNRPSPRNRPPLDTNHTQQLGLLDLVSMCVDVAKGCCYMEELHFVHRDLAARNCLVSSLDPHLRVVKIGDFGLARDIYRNDYYRKEGEGLLPVRWMAPESLMDGVFTSQTDVWSFGVLLWEILTLGQQPYPARTNLQVLHFVRAGGRLDRPPNCPDSLFDLMMSCWSYDPTARPSFTVCLTELANLQDKLQQSPFTAVHNGHYIGSESVYPAGNIGVEEHGAVFYSNQPVAGAHNDFDRRAENPSINGIAHRLDRCGSARSIQRTSSTSSITRSSSTTCLTNSLDYANSNVRYLELLCDNFTTKCNEGYELPIPRNIDNKFCASASPNNVHPQSVESNNLSDES